MKRVVIQTPRLTLREFIPEDAAFMYMLNADEEVIRFTGDVPFKNLDEARLMIESYPQYEKYGYGRWTITSRDTDQYLGWCGLNFNEDIRECDLGFRLLRTHWGKGIATEAASASIQHGFHLGLSKIIGRAMNENRASIRVLDKVGMHFEKEFEAHGGKCVQYSIFKTIQ